MEPKVTVIVPVYKVENTLKKCVDSLCQQTLKDIEIILVDDGSPDKCPELCDELAKFDKRIKVIHKANQGLGFARNSGLEIASGEYVGFVDSDDYVKEDMFEKLYNAAKQYHAEVACGGTFYVHDGKILESTSYVTEIKVWEGKEEVKEFLMDCIASDVNCPDDSKYASTVTKGIFLCKLIKEHKLRFYSEREYVSEDGLFNMDYLPLAQRVVMLPEKFYFYLYNPDSLTSVYRADRFQKNKELFAFGKEKLWNVYQDKELLIQYGRMFLAAARVCVMQEVFNSRKVGFKIAKKGIFDICNDEVVQQVLKVYPYEKLPVKKRVFAFLMKHKFAFLQYMIVKVIYMK